MTEVGRLVGELPLSPDEALELAESLRSTSGRYASLIEYVRKTVEQNARLETLVRDLTAMSDGYTLRHEGIQIALAMVKQATRGGAL